MLKTNAAKTRDGSIELIRVVSMLLVVLLHIVGWGGVARQADGFSAIVARGLESLSYCCVNLFALVSGYVSFGRKQRWDRLAELWFQVLFYSVGGFVLYFLLTGSIYGGRVAIFKSLFPVSGREYWYFSSFFLLFCFRPLIDKLLMGLEKIHFRILVLSGCLLFCVIGVFIDDSFATAGGYTSLWLIYLYCLGAYLKACPEDFHRKRWAYLLGFVTFSVLTLLIDKLGRWTGEILGFGEFFNDLALRFDSVPVLAASVCLFLALRGLEIKRGQVPIQILSAVSFDVYLIHVHRIPFAWLKDRMAFMGEYPWYKMIGVSLGVAALIYLVCGAIGWLRIGLFRLTRVDKLSRGLAGGIEKLLLRLCK